MRFKKMTPETLDYICEQISLGRSMVSICKEENMPARGEVIAYLEENKEFANNYARSKDICADLYAEQIIEIADETINDFKVDEKTGLLLVDNEAIQRSRLRVDARKWVACKLKPKKYGDHLDLTTGGDKLTMPNAIEVILPQTIKDLQNGQRSD